MQAVASRAATATDAKRSSSQVNVRMNPMLKATGDAALDEVGLSPSNAVRRLWEVMAQRGEARERLLEALGITGEQAKRELERERRIALVESMAKRHAHPIHAGDVNPAALPTLTDDGWEELVWADYAENRKKVSHA